jgi:hypothetical protein
VYASNRVLAMLRPQKDSPWTSPIISLGGTHFPVFPSGFLAIPYAQMLVMLSGEECNNSQKGKPPLYSISFYGLDIDFHQAWQMFCCFKLNITTFCFLL